MKYRRSLTLLAAAALLGMAVLAARRALHRMIIDDLEEKTVLIIGAPRGLGYALAEAYISRGANVVICARESTMLEQARASLTGRSGTITTIVCDVNRPEEVEAMMQQVMELFGRLDILINNADERAAYSGGANVTAAALPLLRRTPASRVIHIDGTAHGLPLRRELAGGDIAVTTVQIRSMPLGDTSSAAVRILAASQLGRTRLVIPRRLTLPGALGGPDTDRSRPARGRQMLH